MKRNTITLIDIIAYLINDLLAWFIIICFDLTGYDNKFYNIRLHWVILVIGITHIIASTICCLYFYKEERTKYKIRIGKKLLLFNEIMTIFPYLYLLFT